MHYSLLLVQAAQAFAQALAHEEFPLERKSFLCSRHQDSGVACPCVPVTAHTWLGASPVGPSGIDALGQGIRDLEHCS
jgi:hypothetical protein